MDAFEDPDQYNFNDFVPCFSGTGDDWHYFIPAWWNLFGRAESVNAGFVAVLSGYQYRFSQPVRGEQLSLYASK